MRTKVSSITLLAGILLILVLRDTVAQSATIYVPDNYSTIHGAIGAANGGDTIIVRVGTHIIASKLTVPEQINLTFAPGVVVKFGGGCWLRVYGDLIAEGTSDAPIVFTSIKDDFYGGDTNDDENATAPAKNDWGNILFWDTSDGSILDHVVVKYGGQTYSFPMWQSLPAIHVFTSNLVLSNSTITENGDYGIYVVNASPTIIENVITNNSKSGIRLLNASPQIADNTITGAGQYGIIATNSNPIIENNVIGDNAGWAIGLDPSSSGARIQGNDLFGPGAGILVLAGDLEASVTWNSDSVYVIDYYRDQYRKHLTVKEGATLTIETGVVVKFERVAQLFVKGDLIAEGTSEEQIVFTSLKDDLHGGDTNGDGNLTAPAKNDWGNIVLWYTSQQSVLAHTVVMYAGQTWSFPLYQSLPAIHVLTPMIEIRDSFITENGVDGIYAFPHVQSNIVIEGNIISKNGRDGIRLYYASAKVVGNTLAENRYGISLKYSPGSEVYLNNFMDNYRHALSTDSVCFWHSDRRSYTYNGNAYTNYLGNYWDDYTGTDAHGDGIGDTPYPIDSDQDSYPLMMPFENYEIGGEEPPEPPPEPWSFVQITDTHIRGEDARDSLSAAVLEICNLSPSPDFVLVTGDIADWGCTSSCGLFKQYGQFTTIMQDLEHKNIAYYPIPGNHDRWLSFAGYEAIIGLPEGVNLLPQAGGVGNYWFEHNGFMLIGLDTGPGNWNGVNHLTLSQVLDLDWCAWKEPSMPKIVFMHHPAAGGGGREIAEYRDRFLDWCDKYNARVVITGHTHEDIVCDRNGVDGWPVGETGYIQTPSCGKEDVSDRGYRIFDVIGGEVSERGVSYIQNTLEYVIKVKALSPVKLHVYDSQGGHVGVDSSGEVERGIPRSFYLTHYSVETEDGREDYPDKILIFDPTDDYLYEVVGTEEGNYGLVITSVSGGEETTFEAAEIPISPGARHVYAVNWEALSAGEEGVILNIDNDGDGVFVQMVIADNDLSYDEFALQTETVVDFDPDTLNLKSEGKFATVYIELPEDFDVSEIDLFSLELNELVPPLPKPIEIGDYDSDGINDLMVKFDLQELIEVLEPGEQMVDLTGRLWDGRPIAGFDFIRVIH